MSLPYDRASLVSRMESGFLPEWVFFWGHTPAGPGTLGKECLSQWYPARFEVRGQSFATAEHFMMHGKATLFGDDDAARAILGSTDPAEVKAMGRAVRNYDDARWEAARFAVVVEGNTAKFSQDPRLRAFLLETKDAVLVEAAPRDTIWGIGLGASNPLARTPTRWRGRNLLGFALMAARDAIRAA
ncbi:MAG: NADAR family protein [Polyangiaceae bacterium]